ncbi:hypothetical protein FHR71_004250 [Methylobacterium sp. RAS18]|nr:hypothetical protein [Methylobacterium sp. RAS18]
MATRLTSKTVAHSDWSKISVSSPFSPKTLWSRLDEVINRPRPYTRAKGMLTPQPRATPQTALLA